MAAAPDFCVQRVIRVFTKKTWAGRKALRQHQAVESAALFPGCTASCGQAPLCSNTLIQKRLQGQSQCASVETRQTDASTVVPCQQLPPPPTSSSTPSITSGCTSSLGSQWLLPRCRLTLPLLNTTSL